MKTMGGIFFSLFISIFYAVGIGMLWFGIRNIARARTAHDWPATPAAIESCELAENSDSDGSTWSVKVRYTYKVGARTFTGDRVAFGYTGSSDRGTHSALLEKLNSARTVSAHYNPLNPAESTLTTGTTREHYTLLAFAVTWLTFVIGFTAIWTLASGRDTPLINRIEILEPRGPEAVR
jgi:hypothetical protein